MKHLVKLAALLVLIAPVVANADPIYGELGFVGTVTPSGGDPVNNGLSDATGLQFGTALTLGAANGSFASIAPFTLVAFTDFQFDPFAGSVSPLWMVTDLNGDVFTFVLEGISVDMQTFNALVLSGTGTLYRNGADATAGQWDFSASTSGSSLFTFSATSVSEPATLAILGLGLAAFGMRRRKKVA